MTRLAYRYYIFDFYDTFAYVYGLLNSREYQEKYANDLKKDLARIPIVKHKEKYVEVGKALMDLHLNYEEVPVYDDVEIQFSAQPSYKVTKMKFIKKGDRSTIVFNNEITIKNIPEKAYEYMVNGRSAIEWIMDQYQIKTDKKSGITDDPNDNAVMERFYNTLKHEFYYLYKFDSNDILDQKLYEFVYGKYNHVRSHRANGGLTPYAARCRAA